MKIVQSLIEATPKWAAKAQVILVAMFTLIVGLQETKVIDILPIDEAKREAIRSWVAVAAVIGGLYLSSRKSAQVTTTVTTPPELKEPPPYDINSDMHSLKP